MLTEKVFYYDPNCGINPIELHDVLRRIPLIEWYNEGLRVIYVTPSCFSGDYDYGAGTVGFRFNSKDERNPLIITGTNQRQMNEVVSKLTKILKMGKLNRIDEGELVSRCNLEK